MHSQVVYSKKIVEKGWRQDATLANSDSCLKPVITGYDRNGALAIEGFNCINQVASNGVLLHYQPVPVPVAELIFLSHSGWECQCSLVCLPS